MTTLPSPLAGTRWAARLAAAVRAAESAGAALIELRGSGLFARDAAGGQLKTAADEAAEGWVVGYLRAAFPGEPILSEEAFEREGREWPPCDAYWIVDALDGTRSYRDGFDGFCVQVAYVEGGVPCVGVVFEPAAKRCYLAARGEGAFLSEGGEARRLRLGRTTAPAERPVCVDSTPPAGAAGEWFRRHDARFLELGSIGLKICRVADGSADVFLKSLRFKLWDVAPGELILNEAGGRLTLWNGEPVPYGSGRVRFQDLLAAAAGEVDRIVAEMAEIGDQAA